MNRTVRRAVVIVNVGSPDAPAPGPVRRYLKQFLSDPRVLDEPWLVRQIVLHAFILPFRPKKSAEAYAKVWTPEGSPLLALSRRQRAKLAERLPGASVHLAMRYGQPSFEAVTDDLRRMRVEEVLLVPMYPQYASASTGSAVEAFSSLLARGSYVPAMSVLPPTWDDPAMLDAWAGLVRRHIDPDSLDGVIFSYHGLPERQVRACDPLAGTEAAHCFARESCCEEDAAPLHACYRAQSLAATREIARRLGLSRERVFCGFQSRLGNTKWIGPYSDTLYEELPKKGVNRVAVVCPSFLTDCLETLEEVAIRGREQFLAAGGQSFVAVPCLNDDDAFIDALAAACARRMPGLV